MKRFSVLGALLLVASPVDARDLPVPADKGWQHAQTGVVVMPQVAGFRRTALTDATDTEHDVAAQFGEDAEGTFATLYLFKPAAGGAAVWFDRAQTALDAGATGKGSAPATIEPVAFALPGGTATTAVRQVHAIPGGPYRSTALAVVPVGDWLVKLRITSRTLTAERLDARLTALVAGLRWPARAREGAAFALVQPCAAPLDYGKAKVVKADGAGMFMSLILPGVIAKQPAAERGPPALWCREGERSTDYAAYRADGSVASYILAYNDAGRIARIAPPILAEGKGKSVTVTTEDVDGTVSAYPSFSAPPRPAQVWKLLNSGRPTSRAKGDQITIDAGSL